MPKHNRDCFRRAPRAAVQALLGFGQPLVGIGQPLLGSGQPPAEPMLALGHAAAGDCPMGATGCHDTAGAVSGAATLAKTQQALFPANPVVPKHNRDCFRRAPRAAVQALPGFGQPLVGFGQPLPVFGQPFGQPLPD